MGAPTVDIDTGMTGRIKIMMEKRLENLKKSLQKTNMKYKIIKYGITIVLVIIAICTEISNQRININFSNLDARTCEDLSEVDDTMREIAVDALAAIRKQGRRIDSETIRTDPDGAMLITVDVNIGDLTAEDVATFNKYINCTGKFGWLHPENNEYSYWIEIGTAKQKKEKKQEIREQKREKLREQKTAQTELKEETGAPADSDDKPAKHPKKKMGHKHRNQHGKKQFKKSERRGLKHGDIKRIATNANTTELKWEMIFNDNICLRSGNPHTCLYEDDQAHVVYRARIQRSVPWFGTFKIGQMSAAVIPGAEPDQNILRTKLALGGSEARFISSSLVTRGVNIVLMPFINSYLYSKEYAEDVHTHFVEENFIAASLMQYLHEPLIVE